MALGNDAPALRLSVLGPLRLMVGGHEVPVPGARRRAVLAMLVMAAPHGVTCDRLVDSIWPTDAPASGRSALQSHASRLRRHLGPCAGRLVTTGAGYRLDLSPGELDVTEASLLLTEARRAWTGPGPGGATAALPLVAQARGLWRGEPLAGLRDVAPLAAWAHTLTDLWFDATALLVEVSLAAGEIDRAVGVANEGAAADPLREQTAMDLVRALSAAGRAPDALRAAHRFRRRLREETGLDPSPGLAELEHLVASGKDTGGTLRAPASRSRLAPADRFVGRDAEVAGLARLLATERLVTVVGPAGVGKTRLALEAADRAARWRAVTVMHLAEVTDASAVPDVLARTLRLQPGTGDLVERCAHRLQSDRALLVVDNCEHVLEAARRLLTVLLAHAPDLTVLATSRERLALASEQTCRLAPLPLPDPAGPGDPGTEPSVALFLERARRARPGFGATRDELAAVVRLVRALDGVPLAIELAAGRLSSMAVPDLEARLDRALDLLSGRPAAIAAGRGRYRSLRGAIEWSYDLLPAGEKGLLRNLAVFPAGFDLEAAEEVASQVGVEGDPATAVEHLVESSLLSADLEGSTRYRMLDTLRQFGLDRLAAEGEAEAASERFRRWALDAVRRIDSTIDTTAEPDADRRLRAELANLRTAWRSARDGNDLDTAASLLVGLFPAVCWRDLTEVWRWSLELVEDPALAGHPAEAAVLGMASEAAWLTSGDLHRAEALARRGVALARPEEPLGWRITRWSLGHALLFRGRYGDAVPLVLDTRIGTRWESEGYAEAALAAAYQGDLAGGRDMAGRAVAAARSPTLYGYARYAEGEVANAAGDWPSAEAAYRDALAAAATTGATFLEGIALVGLVSVHGAAGQVADALAGYRDLIDRWERAGAWTQQWTTLRNLAALLDRLGEGRTAGALRAAADAAPESATVGSPRTGFGHAPHASGPARGLAGRPPPDRDTVLAMARDAIDRVVTPARSARPSDPGIG